jgi:hypothetical protein
VWGPIEHRLEFNEQSFKAAIGQKLPLNGAYQNWVESFL